MERKIIVIGMDNTGKTTLVNQLKEKLNCDSIKSMGPGYTREEMKTKAIQDLTKEELVILERFPMIEEMVYGTVLRNHSNFEIQDIIDIKQYDPFIIYCRPNRETIFNFGDREQMKGVIEEKDELLTTFDWLVYLLNHKGFNIVIYDYQHNNYEDLITLYRSDEDEYNPCKN